MQQVCTIITQRNMFIGLLNGAICLQDYYTAQYVYIIITQRNRFISLLHGAICLQDYYSAQYFFFIGLLKGAICLYDYYTAQYQFSSSSSSCIRSSVGLYAGCMLLISTRQSDAGTVGKYALCKPGAVYIYASFYVEAMLCEYFHSFICMYVHNMYINHAL